MIWAWFLGALILLEIVADIAAKEYSLHHKLYIALISLAFYVIANTCWIISLRYRSELAVGANIFSVATGVLTLLIGAGLYNEILSCQQYVGIFLGIVSLYLLLQG